MIVVLEGPDGAGKTTLALQLAFRLGLQYQASEGPGKSQEEIDSRIKGYLARGPGYLYDRHPCISQVAYSQCGINTSGILPSEELLEQFYEQKPIIVYCRPPNKVIHSAKGEWDTPDFIERIDTNYHKLRTWYDLWAVTCAQHIYRYTDEGAMERLMSQLNCVDFVSDIEMFHRKFKLEYLDKPRALPEELADFRTKFLREELTEYIRSTNDAWEALQYADQPGLVAALEGQLDALVDLVYVALGTSYLHGFDFREAWRRVQLANMAKRKVRDASESKRGSIHDVIKPEGWVAPKHTDLVEDNAHK